MIMMLRSYIGNLTYQIFHCTSSSTSSGGGEGTWVSGSVRRILHTMRFITGVCGRHSGIHIMATYTYMPRQDFSGCPHRIQCGYLVCSERYYHNLGHLISTPWSSQSYSVHVVVYNHYHAYPWMGMRMPDEMHTRCWVEVGQLVCWSGMVMAFDECSYISYV